VEKKTVGSDIETGTILQSAVNAENSLKISYDAHKDSE